MPWVGHKVKYPQFEYTTLDSSLCIIYGIGTGRHSYDEVAAMGNESLESLSKIIGDKPFLLGNEPCEDDAAIFGLLAQGVYSSPGAPFHVVFESI